MNIPAPNYKNLLQQMVDAEAPPKIIYETSHTGPPHAPEFRGSVYLLGLRFDAPHSCKAKKDAEQAAARVAVERLGQYDSLRRYVQRERMVRLLVILN